MSIWKGFVVAASLACGAACTTLQPYVQYSGVPGGPKPKPAEAMEVHRASAPPRSFRDLGTVSVTCPSEGHTVGHSVQMVGGCSYERAVWLAGEKAAAVGADGIHALDSNANAAGNIVSLRASAFVYVAAKPEAAPAANADDTSVEGRLRRLDKLKADHLITPQEYDAKRAEILRDF